MLQMAVIFRTSPCWILLDMKPPIPDFQSDLEAEQFVADSDLSLFDLSGASLVRFELRQPQTVTHQALGPSQP
jgi:hypothetical protein